MRSLAMVGVLASTHAWAQPLPEPPLPQPVVQRPETVAIDPNGGAIWAVEEFDVPSTPARTTWRLDLATGAWERIATTKAPTASASANVAFARDALWIVGGTGADGWLTNEIWRFDTKQRSWDVVTFKNGPRAAAGFDAMFVDPDDKHLWISGGAEKLDKAGIGTAVWLGTWQLDLDARTWRRISRGKPPTSNTALMIDRDHRELWMVGGYGLDNNRDPLQKTFRFGRGWKEVSTSGDVPSPRSHLQGAVVDGSVWVFGGIAHADITGARLDIKTRRWETIRGGPPANGGWEFRTVADPGGHAIWVVGTRVVYSATATVTRKAWRLDTQNATWSEETAPTGTCGALLLDDPRRSVWCIGASTWQLDLKTRRWKEHVALPAGWSCPKDAVPHYENVIVTTSDASHKRGCAVQRGGWTWHGPHLSQGPEYEVGAFNLGKKQGRWTQHRTAGTTQERHYRDDKLDGRSTTWALDGTKLFEGTYRAGKPHGVMRHWYAHGKLRQEASYLDGRLDGITTEYLEDGTPSRRVAYRNGRQHGPYVSYHPEHRPNKPTCCAKHKAEQGSYVDGVKDGVWTHYDAKGVKIGTITFKRGHQVDPPVRERQELGPPPSR